MAVSPKDEYKLVETRGMHNHINICLFFLFFFSPFLFYSLTCIHPLQFLYLSPPPPPLSLIHISKVKYEEEKTSISV